MISQPSFWLKHTPSRMARTRSARWCLAVRPPQAAREIGCSFSTITRAEAGQDLNLNNALAILKWVNE